MNTETQPTPTAAELLAEWKDMGENHSEYRTDLCNDCGHRQRTKNYWLYCESCGSKDLLRNTLSPETILSREAIAARLDEACESMLIKQGQIFFSVEMYCAFGATTVERINEMIALLEWTAIRELQKELQARAADDYLMRGHKWENTHAKAGERDICNTCGLMRIWRGTFSDYYRNGRTTTDLECTNQSNS